MARETRAMAEEMTCMLNAFTLTLLCFILIVSTCKRIYTIDNIGDFCFLGCMAKQTGPIKITGTIDNTCFYKLEGEYYARQKSSLSRRRVKTSTAFKETMRYAGLLAKASVIASKVYSVLPPEKKNRKVYQQLTGKAMRMLKDSVDEGKVLRLLRKE